MAEQAELGDLVRDTITKFEGVVVAITHWLHGCDRIELEPVNLDKDGRPGKYAGFDVYRIEVIQKGYIKNPMQLKEGETVATKPPGGPRPSPSRY